MIAVLEPIFQFISGVLAVFYEVTHSYAAAIALLTIVIMIAVLPLTLKSTKSMLEMQQLQPEMKRIQQQYTDMQQRNEAMMALYKEHNVSPLGGCLPMLLPLPVFYVMWSVIRGLTRTCTEKLVAAAPFTEYAPVKAVEDRFCPDHIGTTTDLFTDLVGRTKMVSFGLDLAQPALDTIRDSFVKGLPYIALVLLVTGTSYYQQRQVTVRNKNAPVNPQQQMLLRIFPAMTGVFSLFFPAALIGYWLVQNLFRIAQNYYITRRFYGEGGLGHKANLASQAARDLQDKKGDKAGAGKAKTGSPKGAAAAVSGKSGGKTAAASGRRDQASSKGVAASSARGKQSPRPKPPQKPSAAKRAAKADTGPASSPAPNGSAPDATARPNRPAPQRPKPARPTPRPKPEQK